MSQREAVPPRQTLLDAILLHVESHGTHELSLRGVAAAVGTSHRMLSYHFGSREGLLVAITQAVEQRQRDALTALIDLPDLGPLEVMDVMYRRLVDPALWPQERLFFDLYARALTGHEHARGLLDDVIDAWVDPIATLFTQLGFAPDAARAEARLAIAVARGLLLDLLATADEAAVETAAQAFLDRYRPDSPGPAGSRGCRGPV